MYGVPGISQARSRSAGFRLRARDVAAHSPTKRFGAQAASAFAEDIASAQSSAESLSARDVGLERPTYAAGGRWADDEPPGPGYPAADRAAP